MNDYKGMTYKELKEALIEEFQSKYDNYSNYDINKIVEETIIQTCLLSLPPGMDKTTLNTIYLQAKKALE